MIAALTKRSEVFMGRSRMGHVFCAFYYNRILDREIALGAIQAGDKVLFIGGGPMPYSAYYLNKKTSAEVDVIDHDQSVLSPARAYLKSKNAPHVHVHHGSVDTYCIQTYDHIILAKQLMDKPRIVSELQRRKPDLTRLIVRTSLKETLPECSFEEPLPFRFVKALWVY